MRTSLAITLAVLAIMLGGCPPQRMGSGHSRPHGHQDTTIAISPDDQTILFNADGEGGRDLYLLHLADLSVSRVAATTNYETDATFSPDGRQIVFSAGVTGDPADHIFVSNLDGSGRVQLTFKEANDTTAKFSPDGKWIVFARDKTYNYGGLAANWDLGGVICVIGVDGQGETEVTPADVHGYTPWFSDDGKTIFYSSLDGLYSIPLDSSAPPKRIGPTANFAVPVPQTTTIVFAAGKYSPEYELFVSEFDGSKKTQLTDGNVGCFQPIISASGDRVYFLEQEWPQGPTGEPKFRISTIKMDGTERREVTDLRLFDDPLGWKPTAQQK